MLVHEVKHANVKHIAKSKMQFMVPILEILLLIQLQGGNNAADLPPKKDWWRNFEHFYQNMGQFTITLHSALDCLTLPMCSEFSIKIGDVFMLILAVPNNENALGILT